MCVKTVKKQRPCHLVEVSKIARSEIFERVSTEYLFV